MKALGALTLIALLAGASIVSAQSQSRSRLPRRLGSGYGSTYTGDRSGGMSFGGM